MKNCRRKVGCLIEHCKGTRHTLLHKENLKDPEDSIHKKKNKPSEIGCEQSERKRDEILKEETLPITSNTNMKSLKKKVVALPVKIIILNGCGL